MALSRLDYSNSLLFGCSASNVAKLQRIQNTAARIVLNTQRLCPSQQLLQNLHWLPVYFVIKTKIATLTYKVATLNQPLYPTHLPAPYTMGRSIQSQDKQFAINEYVIFLFFYLLLEPAVSTVIGSRGFSYAASSIWNRLPLKIHNSSSFASFKRNFKTYYFSHAFSQTRLAIFPQRLPVPQTRPSGWPCACYKWLYCIVLHCVLIAKQDTVI